MAGADGAVSFLSIDDTDPRPPFQQLVAQVLSMIAAGELVAGDRLAPIRQLAGDLSIAPNTVARAYRELESIGVVVSRGRRGTLVGERSADVAARHETRHATAGLESAVDAAVHAGLDPLVVLETVQRRLERRRRSG